MAEVRKRPEEGHMTKKVVSSPKNKASYLRQQEIASRLAKHKENGESRFARTRLKKIG